jgi:hypothetical protein
MALFRCDILGENFPGLIIGESRPVGFYTTRFVEADSTDEAEAKALEILKDDEAFNISPTARSTDAKVYFENIVEVPADTERIPNRGFTFFVMGT